MHKGKIITTTGKEVGEHEGVEFYTIGQCHGIDWAGGGTPYYVTGKDAEKNILYVGEGAEDKELYAKTLRAVQPHWITDVKPEKCRARIRYRQPMQECEVVYESDGTLTVMFTQAQRAVTPGQSIVFYDGDVVVGGAVISCG